MILISERDNSTLTQQQPCGLLFVFSGPSGAGKNTIMEKVIATEFVLHQLPTATTRPRRDNEQEGREHEFLTEDEFRQRILDKALIEWQIIHDKGVYGVPRKTIQRVLLENRLMVADVDVLGAMELKREFKEHVVLVFVEAPSKEVLRERLSNRSDVKTEQELNTRLRRADFEMGFADFYDYRIVNHDGQLDSSVEQVTQIIGSAIENRPPCNQTLGWKPEDIHATTTGLLVQDGYLLQYQHTFPNLKVPSDHLPFEVLHRYFANVLNINVQPTRPHANQRRVAMGFEPPQMVEVNQYNDEINKNYIYVLKVPLAVEHLPEGWQWVAINDAELSPSLHDLLLQVVGDLQTD